MIKSWIENGNWIEKGKAVVRMLNSGEPPNGNIGRIVHDMCPWGSTHNYFCLIIGETPKTVVLMRLPRVEVSGDGWSGKETPLVRYEHSFHPDFVVRAWKRDRDGEPRFVTRHRRFDLWDNKPKAFNHLD